MDKKIAIVLVVVVVAIVAVAAAVLLMNNNNNNTDPNENIQTQLQIRGNVDGNYTIDSKDMNLFNEVMGGKKALKDYPLADVNADGKVDATDKSLLQDLIDRKNGASVYVVCQDNKGETTTQVVKYPLRNVVTYATNMQLPALYAGVADYIAGYFSKSYDFAEGALSKGVDLKGSSRTISDAAWSNFTKLDADLKSQGGVGAVLIDYSGIAQFNDARMADMEAAGIPALIYSSADATDEITTVLTLGFLFGGDCEKNAINYAKKSWDVIDYIDGKLKNRTKDSYISFTMRIYIAQNDSTFNYIGASAGGIPYYKINSEFAEKYKGSSSVAMTGPESLSNYKDVNALISVRSMDWNLTAAEIKEEIVGTWEYVSSKGVSSQECFKGFEDKLFYVNNLLPGAVKVAYAAHGLYGDLFSMDWADGILKDFVDMKLSPLREQTRDTVIPYFDYEDYKAAKG